MKKNTEIEQMQHIVDDWVVKNGGYWSPLAMLASITEELGEIAREINHLENIKIKKENEKKNTLKEELGDILFSIICIANHYNIDLEDSFNQTIKKYTKRDWGRFNKDSERNSKKNGEN